MVHSYVIKARQRQGGRWSLSQEIILASGPTRRSLQKFNSQTTPPNTQNKIDHQQVCEKSRLDNLSKIQPTFKHSQTITLVTSLEAKKRGRDKFTKCIDSSNKFLSIHNPVLFFFLVSLKDKNYWVRKFGCWSVRVSGAHDDDFFSLRSLNRLHSYQRLVTHREQCGQRTILVLHTTHMCDVSLYNAPNQHGKQIQTPQVPIKLLVGLVQVICCIICLFEKFIFTPKKKL